MSPESPGMDSMGDKTVLANGVRILSQKMPFVQSVSMGVWIHVGSRDEAITENGLSHFIEHMIFKGTEKRTAFEIAKAFDAIGGYTNAFTTMETTCYHAKVMVNHLETMTEILTDIFLNSVFDETEIEKERPVVFQEIGMMEDTPDEYVHQLASRAFWGAHPLGRSILGDRSNIMKFTSQGIRDFFKRLYQPDRMIIAAAGNIEHDYLVHLLSPVFETIQPGKTFPVRLPPSRQSGIHIHSKDLEQLHVCINTGGVSSSDPRRYVLSLMNTILGGNMSSRLFQRIREERGLAYSVYSFASSFTDSGTFGVYAGVDPDHLMETVNLMLHSFQEIRSTPVTEDELRYAKEFTLGNLLMSAESNENQMVRLAQSEIHFGRYTYMDEIIEKLNQVTADDIQQLAMDMFHNDQMTLTLHGPAPETLKFDQMMSQ